MEIIYGDSASTANWPARGDQSSPDELPPVNVYGPARFRLDKRKYRMIFENETEDSVDILVIPKSDKPNQ